MKVEIRNKGFSFIEILVVIGVFAALAVIATQIVAIVITGSKKSESLSGVRSNVDYAFNVMERQIRGATTLDCAASTTTSIVYTDEDDVDSELACTGGIDGYISLNSERITSDSVSVDCTNSVFSCTPPSGTSPPTVDVTVVATSANIVGDEGAYIMTSSKFSLRSF